MVFMETTQLYIAFRISKLWIKSINCNKTEKKLIQFAKIAIKLQKWVKHKKGDRLASLCQIM